MQTGQRVRIISTGQLGIIVSTYYFAGLGGVTVLAPHPNWHTELYQWCLASDIKAYSDQEYTLSEELELIIGELK